MKLQKLSILTTFLVLIIALSAHGMEPNNNDMHPLLCLPLELQHQIIFPQYTQSTEITGEKMDELKEVVKTFFIFNIVSKDFNQHLKLSWSYLTIEQKNKMLKERMDPVVFPYQEYRIVLLALVYSGAEADVKPEHYGTCLSYAVKYEDESAIAMLLNHNADPNQLGCDGAPICFHAGTFGIIDLFLKKVDKDKLLSKSNKVIYFLLYGPLDVMKFWIDYGVNPDYIREDLSECMFHHVVRSLYLSCHTINNALAKGELLLNHIPDRVNWKDTRGRTPIDFAVREMESSPNRSEGYEKLIALFREHGGKTAKELEAENIK